MNNNGVKVKICGITSVADARVAVEAGADALGFIFHERSPRKVTLAQVAEIIRELPPFVAKVGVFVDAPEELIQRAISDAGIDTVQLHGSERPDFAERFKVKVVKAFRVRDGNSLLELPPHRNATWLLDSYVPGAEGGTGEVFNWDLAVQARNHGRPIILAGGLTPENVARAVAHVRPFAVDVSSGVEAAPGRKDPQRVIEFITAAKNPQLRG